MKSGFVTILGRPNVGKSTILNALVQHKVSIVAPKAQTTRSAIKGIYNRHDLQIVFIDTPGVQIDPNKMGRYMNNLAIQAANEVDAMLLVIDCSRAMLDAAETVELPVKSNVPLLLILNKIDLVRIEQMQKIKSLYQERYPDARLIETSAITQFNVHEIIKALEQILPEGPLYYHHEQFTDAPLQFLVAEFIREQTITLFDKEIPYSLLVICDSIVNKETRIEIMASIIVERASQKGIIIGKGGEKLKQINHGAKKELFRLLKKQVDLSLNVKVKADWREKETYLKLIKY